MTPGSIFREFNIPHILLFSLAYGGAIGLADILPSSANLVLSLWPAGGIGLASLVLLPRRRWPAMVAAFSVTGFVMAMLIGRSAPASLGFMTANALESTLSALVLTRCDGKGFTLDKVSSIASLVFCAVIVNSCTALIGAATATMVSGMPFWQFWFNWWVVDGISILVITPVVLRLVDRKETASSDSSRSPIEYLAFFAIWIGIVWFAFNSENPLSGQSPHPYLLIALLTWPAIRFGTGALSMALLVLAVITVSSRAILLGPSPLLGDSLALRLLFSQSFLAITTITTWLLSTSFAERRKAEQRLLEQYADLSSLNVKLEVEVVERKQAEEALHLQTVELEEEVAERQMAQESLQEKALLLEEEIEKRQQTQDELKQLNEELEQRVQDRTAELDEKNRALERFNKMFVNRELKMMELKEKIRELEIKSGKKGDQDA